MSEDFDVLALRVDGGLHLGEHLLQHDVVAVQIDDAHPLAFTLADTPKGCATDTRSIC